MRRLVKALFLTTALYVSYSSFSQNYVVDRNFGQCGNSVPELDFDKTYQWIATHVLPNGKILTIGNGQTDSGRNYLVLIQRLHNGAIDSFGFGTNGIVINQFNFQSFAYSSVVDKDEKIIIAGFENDSTTAEGRIPSLYRFNEDGSLDSTFHGDAVFAMLYDGLSSGHLEQLVRWDPTHLIGAGLSFKNNNNGFNGIGVIKLDNPGEPDASFGNLPGFPGRSGIVIDSASHPHVFNVADKVVLPFIRNNGADDTIMLARLNANGTTDNSFGVNGILNTSIRSENLTAIQQADGKLLLGGTLNESGQAKKIQVLRYLTDLTPDPSFGSNGRVILPTIGTLNSDNILHSISQLPGGRLLLIGQRVPVSGFNIRPIVMRLLADGTPDSSFNGIGNMSPGFEVNVGWQGIDSTDSTNFILTHAGNFSLVKFVPDTTDFHETVSDFNYTIEKLKVYFENRSRNAVTHLWDFGDGNSSDKVNPSHEYALPGRYSVTLETSSTCSIDDTVNYVEVKGLYKITPGEGPNEGFVTLRIYGYGFSNASQVILKNNIATLSADTAFFDTASHTLQANFHFNNAATGLYDVIVTTNSRSDTLPQSFEIKNREMGQPWIQVTGPHTFKNFVLIGRYASFKLEYGVTGNATQYMLPLALVIQGKGLLPEIVTQLANRADTSNIPDSLRSNSNGFYQFYDHVNGDSVWVLYMNDLIVQPNITHTFDFSIIARNLDKFSIRAYIGNSLFDPRQLDTLYGLRTQQDQCNDCMQCILDAAGYIPGPFGCAAGIIGLTCSVGDFEITPETSFGEVLDLGLDFATTTFGCATLTGGAIGKLLKKVGETTMHVFFEQLDNFGAAKNCGSALGSLADDGNCNDGGSEDGSEHDPRNSWDPNSKVGPGTDGGQHYINKKDPLIYTVYFENLASATSPALEVEITDTLDKTVMDLSSFRFNRTTIGGVDYPNFINKDSFATDIPMNSKGIFVRVNGKIDTTTGIINWKFKSLDTATMNLVDDPFRGFLPPNTDGILGTGAISYSLQQKASNTHLTTIANKAKIVFDLNPPINTPVWTNIVDTVKPQSQVLNAFSILSDSTFSVKWTGADAHAGIRNYSIAVSVNDSAYKVLAIFGKGADSTVIKGTKGNVYKFISIAKDSADNIEEPPGDPINNPDAVFIFNSALPVKLLSFNAVKENETAKLTWATSTEINSSHFVVEHSKNGTAYTTVGVIKAAGNSLQQNNYTYNHAQPSKGYNYYRLRMVDKDSRFEYSPVRSLRFDKVMALEVIPNPARNKVSVVVSERGGVVRMINSTGRILKEIKIVDDNTILDVSSFAPGMYFISYTTKANRIFTEKLLVQRNF